MKAVLCMADLIGIVPAVVKFWWLNWKSLMMIGLFQRIIGSRKEKDAMDDMVAHDSQLFFPFLFSECEMEARATTKNIYV